MAYTYLEFEKPISDLENKIENLETSSKKYILGTFKNCDNCINLFELTPLVPFSYF